MRKAIPKTIREAVYRKFDGHCAYCGCELEYKDMQVDHIDSVYIYNECAGKSYAKQDLKDSYKTIDELNEIENLMPSCRACNFYKSAYGIEDFRKRISESLERNLMKNFNYRMLLKYGLVTRTPHEVRFYFEK